MFSPHQSYDYHVQLFLADISLFIALLSGKECQSWPPIGPECVCVWEVRWGSIWPKSNQSLNFPMTYNGHYKSSTLFSFPEASIYQFLLLPLLCFSHSDEPVDIYIILGDTLYNLAYYWPYLLNSKGNRFYLCTCTL